MLQGFASRLGLVAYVSALRRRIKALESERDCLATRLRRYRALAIRIGENKDLVPEASEQLTTGPRPGKVEIYKRQHRETPPTGPSCDKPARHAKRVDSKERRRT